MTLLEPGERRDIPPEKVFLACAICGGTIQTTAAEIGGQGVSMANLAAAKIIHADCQRVKPGRTFRLDAKVVEMVFDPVTGAELTQAETDVAGFSVTVTAETVEEAVGKINTELADRWAALLTNAKVADVPPMTAPWVVASEPEG